MAIQKEIRYVITCDTEDCGEEFEWKLFATQAEAIREVRDNGWGVRRVTSRGVSVVMAACPRHNDFDNG